MSLANVFTIACSAMSAQTTRLNTTAINIANAETVSSSKDQPSRARHPVFASVMQRQQSTGGSLFQD
ncbi:flagellar basal body protein, partial [Pseudomonas syringae group genomosp. 7]|uniref:flagellar basal body protein n=1 Tax=Pseudomonas syringae group genomosp. 7 TaxID=251699 RepID=UPI0037706FBB